MNESFFSLAAVKENETVFLYQIKSGKSFKKRLTELGFVKDHPIGVISRSSFGPIVLDVKGSRIALGQGEAKKILVYKSEKNLVKGEKSCHGCLVK